MLYNNKKNKMTTTTWEQELHNEMCCLQDETFIDSAFMEKEHAFNQIPRLSGKLTKKVEALSLAEGVTRHSAYDILYNPETSLLQVEESLLLGDCSRENWEIFQFVGDCPRSGHEHVGSLMIMLKDLFISIPSTLEWLKFCHESVGLKNSFTDRDVLELIALHNSVIAGIVPMF